MMNKVQKNYMVAKAALQTCEEMVEDIEKKYIAENGIRNENGEIPVRVYCIDDEDVFNKANEEVARITQETGTWDKVISARKNLDSAEEGIVKFALSIAPTKIRKTLERGANSFFQICNIFMHTDQYVFVRTLL